MLADAAPREGHRGGVGNVVVALGGGDAVKAQAVRDAELLHVLYHVLLPHQLRDLGEGAVAGIGEGGFQGQGTVGFFTGHLFRAVLVSAIAGEGLVQNIRDAVQRRGSGDHLENGAGDVGRL